ncbi:cysteate racemase [Paenibacillus senegalensis]|uniref:aspartate/glutamate racemase family protein n=1 Tax=Paenibacillus senegalensis TaxID=1465766 RepID=UPI0002888499|nr:amino acid racemase [Paenibacillus senegalensis]
MSKSRTVGIIGGMGPLATVDLMNKIIQQTPARQEQEHLHLIVDQYPQIPDRTAAILGRGSDPVPYLVESARRLESAGAELIAIACNTAHYYVRQLEETVAIPILHMPRQTVAHLEKRGVKKAGLLATDGTLQSRLYQDLLASREIDAVVPEPAVQQHVMQGIYAVKIGDLEMGVSLLAEAANSLAAAGAEVVIAGCTEVPIVLSTSEQLHIINPTEILAKEVIAQARLPVC